MASGPRSAQTYQCHGDDELPGLVQRFWQQEDMSSAAPPLTTEEREAEDHFARTHSRDVNGRYVVRLPLKLPLPDLTGTRRSAARLLGQMERRFDRDAQLRQLYRDFMQEYETLGHMTLAPSSRDQPKPDCFLPHHGVMRKASSPPKIRVVFNGSSAVASGASLNRHLKTGPNLLPALADVLLRWRVHRYVLASDIEKMYRQILVAPQDRHLQQILWRHDNQTAQQEFELNTVTYGLACAPFLAMRSLRQLADDEEARFPRGSAVLRRDAYVDDILTGASSIAEALDLRQQLTQLCTAGGFPLRKWSANSPGLLADIPPEHRAQRDLRAWAPHESHGTLGLQWHPSIDDFSFSTRNIAVVVYTKRSVLSLTARLFDPLGWLAPAVIRAKIQFQSTWLLGIDWDTPLDDTNAQLWRSFQADLHRLEEIRVPRHVQLSRSSSSIEFHGFADASERAYAAVVYVRAETCEGQKEVKLIAAKTKVAPLKTVSLPRLELCAATLLRQASCPCPAHARPTEYSRPPMVRLHGRTGLDPWPSVALENVRREPSRRNSDDSARGGVASSSWTGKSRRLRIAGSFPRRPGRAPALVDRAPLASGGQGRVADIAGRGDRRRPSRGALKDSRCRGASRRDRRGGRTHAILVTKPPATSDSLVSPMDALATQCSASRNGGESAAIQDHSFGR
ncbi:uncharacterized protein LOC115241410 [Formica exsecta]|uniref:uncharacterized protein LOC115241410 n=1 Tax=Formica exsecta TaxID=72781 RepID=UPI001141FE28|nr:uncharacterized protein LOC115241410 [Formica exsecta]